MGCRERDGLPPQQFLPESRLSLLPFWTVCLGEVRPCTGEVTWQGLGATSASKELRPQFKPQRIKPHRQSHELALYNTELVLWETRSQKKKRLSDILSELPITALP
jgi:hypothetical protein